MDLPRPRWSAYEIAVYGGSIEDDLVIAGGYLRVAQIAAERWSLHGPDDSLPVPILYNYRHSVELSLKWLIRRAARIIRTEGYDTRGRNLSPQKGDAKLREDSHSIKKLAERLNTYLGLITDLQPPENRIDDESMATLLWLDGQDDTGETYRYATVGRDAASQPSRPHQTNINFYDEVNRLHHLASLLQGGYSSHLDEFGHQLAEYRQAMNDYY